MNLEQSVETRPYGASCTKGTSPTGERLATAFAVLLLRDGSFRLTESNETEPG